MYNLQSLIKNYIFLQSYSVAKIMQKIVGLVSTAKKSWKAGIHPQHKFDRSSHHHSVSLRKET